jgi:hypothetical protein
MPQLKYLDPTTGTYKTVPGPYAGPPGATGPQGLQGTTGDPGPTGPQGGVGPIGATGIQGIDGPAGNGAAKVDLYLSGATWTRPPNAITVTAVCISSGAGGGGGRRGAPGTVRMAGGGGGGGGWTMRVLQASDLTPTVTVSVAAAGAAGAAATTDDTDGGTGGTSQASSFGPYVRASAATGGAGGTATTGAGGSGGIGTSTGSAGATAGASGGPGAGGGATLAAGYGGASGGGITTGNVPGAGGQGSSMPTVGTTFSLGGVVDGALPVVGYASIPGNPGGGGGGGAASITQAAQSGAVGGVYGGGGGGGGASTNGFNSGAGAVGGRGMVMVVTEFAATKVINAQTGTSYSLLATDAGGFVTMSNAAASTLTVPSNSVVPFPIGTIIEGVQLGAGQVTLTPGASATISGTPGLKVAAQYGTFGLMKIATDTWIAYGRLA